MFKVGSKVKVVATSHPDKQVATWMTGKTGTVRDYTDIGNSNKHFVVFDDAPASFPHPDGNITVVENGQSRVVVRSVETGDSHWFNPEELTAA